MTTAAPPAPAEEAAALSVKQQDSILDSFARLNIWEGSIRSGKTIASILRWLLYVKSAPPGPLAVIGRTRDTVTRNVMDVIADLAPGAISYTPGAPRGKLLGRTVHVLGAHDKKAEKVLRGLTLAGAYVDEITVIPEDFFTQLLGRLSVPGAKLFGTTNPDNPAHWLRKKFLLRVDELNLYTVHFNLFDNPGLSDEYKRDTANEFTGLWYKRFILGLWVAAEGAIYDMLDEARHQRTAPARDRWRAAWVAADYGTSNPTHAVLLVLAADDTGADRLWAVAEWQHNGRDQGQLTDAVISARLATWVTPLLDGTGLTPVTVLDPSAASLRTQMRADGWPGLRSADNRVDDGIKAVASLLGAGLLLIDTTACPVLWDELCGYVWDDVALEKGIEQPAKVDDHGPDALRYGVMATRGIWRAWLPELAALTDDRAAA
ncbi:PBSX family phage terminase large subunit [Actinokineospora globicatena]|uniref:Phage terminase large subunit n=1 Tax=Actinokineospora globicatena TaxID=103729 RepID=A0A9W6VA78_9PSEU|nr:terminase family protein [Actinokineospora globicatena]GLW91791.1 phage terminase large subunit [Actinokineospora globicatena]